MNNKLKWALKREDFTASGYKGERITYKGTEIYRYHDFRAPSYHEKSNQHSAEIMVKQLIDGTLQPDGFRESLIEKIVIIQNRMIEAKRKKTASAAA